MRSRDREGGCCLSSDSTTKTRSSMTRWSAFCASCDVPPGLAFGPVASSTARMCIAFIAASCLASSASASAMASLVIFVEKSSDDEALLMVAATSCIFTGAIGAILDSSAFCSIQLLSRRMAIVFLDIALSGAEDEFANCFGRKHFDMYLGVTWRRVLCLRGCLRSLLCGTARRAWWRDEARSDACRRFQNTQMDRGFR